MGSAASNQIVHRRYIPYDTIQYPIETVDIQNQKSWCQLLPEGVRRSLSDRYDKYMDSIGIFDNYEGTRGYSMLEQRERSCQEDQRDIMLEYRRAANGWNERNNNWRQVRQQRQLNANSFQELVQHLRGAVEMGHGPQRRGLRVGHININSILNICKFDNIRALLTASEFDVFAVGESKVKGVSDEFLNIEGYRLIRLDRDYPGYAPNSGGILVYVRGNLQVNVVQRENMLREGERSLLQLIELELPFQNVRIVAVYNPPMAENVKAMERVIEEYSDKEGNIVILGDININLRYPNPNSAYETDFKNQGFRQIIDLVTRAKSNTLIDHIYFKQANFRPLIIAESGSEEMDGYADHDLIYCTLGLIA